jgi:hypothetical protein
VVLKILALVALAVGAVIVRAVLMGARRMR